jgi:hypothetical protein
LELDFLNYGVGHVVSKNLIKEVKINEQKVELKFAAALCAI